MDSLNVSNHGIPKTNSTERAAYEQLLFFSLCLGIFLFFRDKNLHLYFDGNTAYSDFSENIFKVNTSYFAESLLLPLLAKLIGASATLYSYKIFCAILTTFILPVLSAATYRYFQNISLSFAFIFILGAIFPWFRIAGLGQPDPVTLMLLMLAAMQKRPHIMFWYILGASLSHFSLVVMTLPAFVAFLLASRFSTPHQNLKLVKLALLAVIVGKLLISIWYFTFDYQLSTRLDWIFERWPMYFMDRYKENIIGFWLTPSLYFLIIWWVFFFYFILLRRFAFSASMIVALICAYLANFITIDGYRIMAVILAGPVAFVVREFVNINQLRIQAACATFNRLAINIYYFITKNWLNLFVYTVITCTWAFTLKAASVHGLLINKFPSIFNLVIQPKTILALLILLITFNTVVIFFTQSRMAILKKIVNIFFLMPLALITLQYFRQIFFYNEPFSLFGKIGAVLFFIFALVSCFFLPSINLNTDKLKTQLKIIFS